MPATDQDRSVIIPTPEQYEAFVRPTLGLTQADFFEHERSRAIELGLMTAVEADPFRNRLGRGFPLLVPRRPKMETKADLDALVKLVVLDGQTGVNYLDPAHLKDEIEVPAGPSLLTGVEDGYERRDTKPSVSRAKIVEDGRFAFTTWRGIVLVIYFPKTLRHHYLDLVGSRYESRDVPSFYLHGERPALDADWEDDPGPRWGAPSCDGSVEL